MWGDAGPPVVPSGNLANSDDRSNLRGIGRAADLSPKDIVGLATR